MHAQVPVVASQRSPLGQRVPVPQAGPPGHALGTLCPHATSPTVAGSGQRGMHAHRRASTSQRSPGPQPCAQRPPQPSSAPHAASAGQRGVHAQRPVLASQVCRGSSQRPMHRPPQPSSAPHTASAGQRGAHTQRPNSQRSLGPRVHSGLHSQVATQRPFTQTPPAGQVTPAQGFRTQRPSAQNSVSAQVTPSQGDGGTHAT